MRKPARVIGAAIVVAACAGLWGSEALHAQQPGFSRKMLQDRNLSAHDRHAVQVVAEFAPGAAAGRHTHPGEELGYVLEGTSLLEIDGDAPKMMKAGDSYFIPAGKIHNASAHGGGNAKVLAIYVVEKGKPLVIPAP